MYCHIHISNASCCLFISCVMVDNVLVNLRIYTHYVCMYVCVLFIYLCHVVCVVPVGTITSYCMLMLVAYNYIVCCIPQIALCLRVLLPHVLCQGCHCLILYICIVCTYIVYCMLFTAAFFKVVLPLHVLYAVYLCMICIMPNLSTV